MKIKYSTPDNLFDFFNESLSISVYRNKIAKTKKYSYNYIKRNILTLIEYIILLPINYFLYIKTENILNIPKTLIFIILLFIISGIIVLINTYLSYKAVKKAGINGTIIVNEEGITDEEDNSKITYKWNGISYIIIGKYSINIFTTNKLLYSRLPIKIKNKLLKELKNYPNIEIIDLESSK